MNNTLKFEVNKSYLMEHTHKAYGGSKWSVRVNGLLEDLDIVILNNKSHKLSKYLESRKIIFELPKKDDKNK